MIVLFAKMLGCQHSRDSFLMRVINAGADAIICNFQWSWSHGVFVNAVVVVVVGVGAVGRNDESLTSQNVR